jgi:hypothetical protein
MSNSTNPKIDGAGHHKLVAFMPWLWLEMPVSVAGFTFVPFLDKTGLISEPLAALQDAFPVILSSYCDIQQRPRETCIVVIDQNAGSPAEPWNLSENKFEALRWAASLLFLASWAGNEYFTPIGSYVNDTNFQLYFQRFTEPPEYVSLSYRRRDGRVLYGGPKHGQMRLIMPLYASSSQYHVETGFLVALNAADVARSPSVTDLKPVLPLVRLANTDNDVMTVEAEAALMGFAFEQYFGADNARELAAKFDALFSPYGKTTAGAAQTMRPGIYPDPNPRYNAAQRGWLVSKMWMLEFHQYRSAVAHVGGSLTGRTWGWSPSEHLVMAAFTLPLAVKLRLAGEGHYSLSREDEVRCRAVDTLLTQTDWAAERGSGMNTKWRSIIREQKGEARIAAAVKGFRKPI